MRASEIRWTNFQNDHSISYVPYISVEQIYPY